MTVSQPEVTKVAELSASALTSRPATEITPENIQKTLGDVSFENVGKRGRKYYRMRVPADVSVDDAEADSVVVTVDDWLVVTEVVADDVTEVVADDDTLDDAVVDCEEVAVLVAVELADPVTVEVAVLEPLVVALLDCEVVTEDV